MKKKLLIIDNEPAIRLILKQYFSASFEVVLKADGQEGLQWLEQGNYADAIVADYFMPNLDGPALIQAIRARSQYRNVVLFILSGNDESSSRVQCLRLGADDYLLKPFNLEELALRLDNRLARLPLAN